MLFINASFLCPKLLTFLFYQRIGAAEQRGYGKKHECRMLCADVVASECPSCCQTEEKSTVARQEVSALHRGSLAMVAVVEKLVELFR